MDISPTSFQNSNLYQGVLFRAVKRSKPDCLDSDGKPSSALFKEPQVSADTDGGRPDEQILEAFQAHFPGRLKALTSFQAALCQDYGITINPAPEHGNPYHEVLTDGDNDMLTSLQAKILADHAEVIFYDENVKWVYLEEHIGNER